MESFSAALARASAHHGHLCPGQVLGVRLARLGCRLVGIEEPRGSKRLIVFIEIDRCATDAISSVTGCTLGRRTLKYVDYGKLASTFLNQQTGQAVRIAAREDSRARAQGYAPEARSSFEAQLAAYQVMPEEELFEVMPVQVSLRPEDEPGPPRQRARCDACGEGVNDGRTVSLDGRTLCRGCAGGAYYTVADDPNSSAQRH